MLQPGSDYTELLFPLPAKEELSQITMEFSISSAEEQTGLPFHLLDISHRFIQSGIAMMKSSFHLSLQVEHSIMLRSRPLLIQINRYCINPLPLPNSVLSN